MNQIPNWHEDWRKRTGPYFGALTPKERESVQHKAENLDEHDLCPWCEQPLTSMTCQLHTLQCPNNHQWRCGERYYKRDTEIKESRIMRENLSPAVASAFLEIQEAIIRMKDAYVEDYQDCRAMHIDAADINRIRLAAFKFGDFRLGSKLLDKTDKEPGT